jgi:hypothetical protein
MIRENLMLAYETGTENLACLVSRQGLAEGVTRPPAADVKLLLSGGCLGYPHVA